jgi:hypothetical protein
VAVPPDIAADTREALHALACYVVSPYRKARTGRIGLRPAEGGFGTPAFDDGSRILVLRDRLVRRPGGDVRITTLRDAARFLDVDLDPDPGVGRDLPEYRPDRPLPVDPDASVALGDWYALGQRAIDGLARHLAPGDTATEAQLWPEHFDLAAIVTLEGGLQANAGFSPGDGFSSGPYAYLGPFDLDRRRGGYWNAPFGAYRASPADSAEALEFLREGLDLLRAERR